MNVNLVSLAALLLTTSASAHAETNSFAAMIQTTSTMQANLTQQMINMNAANSSHSGPSAAPVCLPPIELQRGMNGVVPPELQGDPRYQQYLRCSRNQPDPQYAPPPPARHLPITATDFAPVAYGHPIVDQSIAQMPIAHGLRVNLRNAVESMFTRVATDYRRNNLAVSMALAYSTALNTVNGTQMNPQQTRDFVFGVNDMVAQAQQFALMTPMEKQNNSDSLIFQTAMILMLRELGQRDPAARLQAIELSRLVLQHLGS